MEKGQAEIAWRAVMMSANEVLETLAGCKLPDVLLKAPEPGPGDPHHRAVEFLHEWASVLDGAIQLDRTAYPTAEEATENLKRNMESVFGGLVANPGEQNGMIMDPPDPELTVDGCPLSEVGRLPLWADREVEVDGKLRSVMSAQELAWHMKLHVGTVYRYARDGFFPIAMIHHLGGADVSKRRVGFYRDSVRQFMFLHKHGEGAST